MQHHYDILEQYVPLAERDCNLLDFSIANETTNISISASGYYNSGLLQLEEVEHHQNALRLCRINVAIWDYVAPWYLLIGTIANVVATSIWLRPDLRKHANGLSVTLAVLGGCDIIVLFSGFLRHYLRKTSYIGHDVQTFNAALCKLTEFVVYYSLCFSSWLVSAISVERCLRIVYYDNRNRCCCFSCGRNLRHPKPHKNNTSRLSVKDTGYNHCCCSSRRLRRISQKVRSVEFAIVAIGFTIAAIYGHIFWTRVYDEENRTCRNVVDSHQHFMRNVWPYIDMLFTVLLPHSVTIFASSIIIVHLRCIHRRHQNRQSSAYNIPNLIVDSDNPAVPTRILAGNSLVARHSLRIAFTLACICVFYVVCQLPAKLWLIMVPVTAYKLDEVHSHFHRRLVWTTLIMIQYTAHISNFFIYSLSNEKFRIGLRRLFSRNVPQAPRLRTLRNKTFVLRTADPSLNQSSNTNLGSLGPRRQSAPAWLSNMARAEELSHLNSLSIDAGIILTTRQS